MKGVTDTEKQVQSSSQGLRFGIAPLSAPIFKYNPQQIEPSDLLATLSGRDALLEQMVSHLHEQRAVSTPKHLFLHGTRGMGKTTLLLALRYTVEQDDKLKSAFAVAQFDEEERRIYNGPSFALRALQLLQEAEPELAPALPLDPGREVPEAAFDVLISALKSLPAGRQALFLIDNFDDLANTIVSAKGRSLKLSREGLIGMLEEFLSLPQVLVVGTGITSIRKPKPSFFKRICVHFEEPIQLGALTDPVDFLLKRSSLGQRPELIEKLPLLMPRIEGLNRLADGNPRLLAFLFDYLGEKPWLDLVKIIPLVLDELTPMYTDMIERFLNPGQAVVLDMLAAKGGVGTTKEIALLTKFQDEQTVRTYLNDLCATGFAKPVEGNSRETVFRTWPALFQIWYEMRYLRSRGGHHLIEFFSLMAGEHHSQMVLGHVNREKELDDVSSLLETFAEQLDPEWEELRQQHVNNILARGGSLSDSLQVLEGILEERNASVAKKVGLHVISSQVRLWLQDPGKAREELKAADKLAKKGSPEYIKLQIAWSHFLENCGNHSEALKKAQEALELIPQPSKMPYLRAAALSALASAWEGLSENKKALKYAEEAFNSIDRQDLPALKSQAANLLGLIFTNLSDYQKAEKWHRRSLELARLASDSRAEARSESNLGKLHYHRGEHHKAKEHYEKAAAIFRSIKDRRAEARTLLNLGLAHQFLDDQQKAMEFLDLALSIARSVEDRPAEAAACSNLGLVHKSMGDYDLARRRMEQALQIDRNLENRDAEAGTLHDLGLLHRKMGALSSAQECFESSRQIWERIGNRAGEARALDSLGGVYQAKGSLRLSGEHFQRSLQIAREIGNHELQAIALADLGSLSLQLAEPRRALEHLEEARKLFGSRANQMQTRSLDAETARAFYQLCGESIRISDLPSAKDDLRNAWEMDSDSPPQEALARFAEDLMLPCLARDTALAQPLLDLSSELLPAFHDMSQHWKPIKAALNSFATDGVNEFAPSLKPVEFDIYKSLRDRIIQTHGDDRRNRADETPHQSGAEKEAGAEKEIYWMRKLIKEGRFEEARSSGEKIMRDRPQDAAEALYWLVVALKDLGDQPEYEIRLQQLAELRPREPRVLSLQRSLALEELHSGRIQSYQDLRIGTGGISPVPAIPAMAEEFGGLEEPHQEVAIRVFCEAMQQGQAEEIEEALTAVSKILAKLSALQRSRILDSILGLASNPSAPRAQRASAMKTLDIFYPNLTPSEQHEVRSGLEGLQQATADALYRDILRDFFHKTLAEASKESQL